MDCFFFFHVFAETKWHIGLFFSFYWMELTFHPIECTFRPMEFTFHPLELKTFRCKFKYFIVTLRRNTTDSCDFHCAAVC